MKRVKKTAFLITAMVLCVSTVFNITVFAQDNSGIDNYSREEYTYIEKNNNSSVNSVYDGSAPDGVGDSSRVSTLFIFVLVREVPSFISSITNILLVGTEVEILAFAGDYCLVESRSGIKGYVYKGWLRGGKETKLSLNMSYEQIYVGVTKNRVKAVYDGIGTVTWRTDNTDIISVDSSTGAITAQKPGTAKLIAKVGTQEVACHIFVIFKWKSAWTGKTLRTTTIKAGPGDDTGNLYTLSAGKKFVVGGDDGGTDGWAYGHYAVSSTEKYWGFVKIEDISQKGTVSQYNSLGWTYPVQNAKFNYISSPYGPRSSSSSGRHLGFDISKGSYSSIEGENLVAAFDGEVIWVNRNYNYSTKEPSYGYCVIIESKDADPISGKKLRAVYMHLLEEPTISVQESVTAGSTILGKVGSTGRSSGPHLHFEVNNSEKRFVGSSNSYSFDQTINPIYFYMNKNMNGNDGTPGTKYWYNYNN